MKTRNPKPFLFVMIALVALSVRATADTSDSCENISALESYTVVGVAPEGSECRAFLGQSGKTGVSCSWAFPYRDEVAEHLASELWITLQKCRPGAQLSSDLPVNHPDSYHLRTWAVEDAIYRVSQKDKAGLQRTLVFLRVETP